MKQRLFDSMGSDRMQAHRMKYQDGCGAIHAIGNGEIMLYGRGPEWMQVLGMPYSCPTLISLVVPDGDDVKSSSQRRVGVGSWQHRMDGGEMVDCASRGYHCIARRWTLEKPVRFELDCHDFEWTDQMALFPGGAWMVMTPANAAVYNDYPLVNQAFMLVSVEGDCSVEATERGLMLTLKGEGVLRVTGGQSYGDCVEQMRRACAVSFEEILADADSNDRAFLARCAKNRKPLKAHPQKEAVLAAVEGAALMIRAQQHVGGGVQAGHNYHLAYVRDQYGVSRGLLAMGAWDEAAAILRFYRGVFERWGFIANAQAMGIDGIFHVHENDHTEITGYLLIQAADVLEATGDEAFFLSLKPMLMWALQAQLKELHHGMLPFNGDETYIAGRIVPRTLMFHGAFEATLLMITGGRRFIEYCRKLGAEEPWMAEALRTIDEASARFEENFRREGGYVCNSLRRLEGLVEPEFRHGVCYYEDFFGWLHRVSEGCYVCPKCAGKKGEQPLREEFLLKSTMLMPTFVRADQVSRAYLLEQARQFLDVYHKTGSLPSLPDGDLCLGYDFGLLLFAVKDAGLAADDLLAHMLSLQDVCGAWSEYFQGKEPRQTRCRPWESAINIAGAIRYLSED